MSRSMSNNSVRFVPWSIFFKQLWYNGNQGNINESTRSKGKNPICRITWQYNDKAYYFTLINNTSGTVEIASNS